MITILKRDRSKYEVDKEVIKAILYQEYGFDEDFKAWIVIRIDNNNHKKYGMVDVSENRIWIKETSTMQMNLSLWHEIGHILSEKGYMDVKGERAIENYAHKMYRRYGNLIRR